MKSTLAGASALLTMMKAMGLRKEIIVKPSIAATRGRLTVFVHPDDFAESKIRAPKQFTSDVIFDYLSKLAVAVSTAETFGKVVDLSHTIQQKGLKPTLNYFLKKWSGDDIKTDQEKLTDSLERIETKMEAFEMKLEKMDEIRGSLDEIRLSLKKENGAPLKKGNGGTMKKDNGGQKKENGGNGSEDAADYDVF